MAKGRGIVCEVSRDSVTFFDTKDHILETVPNTYNVEPVIGKLYVLGHLICSPLSTERLDGNVEFYRQNGGLWADTWAVSPVREDLPEAIFKKWGGKVWSPYLGFLRDPERKFERRYKNGGRGLVTVVYAPEGGNTVFQITDIRTDSPDEATPWARDAAGLEPVVKERHPREMVCEKRDSISANYVVIRHGVCIHDNVYNEAHSVFSQGSTLTCNVLFNITCGLMRCLTGSQLGAWYQHTINKKKDTANDFFHTATVAKPVRVEAPLPTRVVNGRVVITATFTFHHEDFEYEENRDIMDWEERRRRIKLGAHFWNRYLGKVQIYRGEAAEIIQRTEQLQSANPNRSNPINVTVNVVPIRNFKAEDYPEYGVFLVQEVLGVEFE